MFEISIGLFRQLEVQFQIFNFGTSKRLYHVKDEGMNLNVMITTLTNYELSLMVHALGMP